MRRFPEAGFEWFHIRTIDLNSDGLLDKLYGDDQTIRGPFGNECAFGTCEYPACDPGAPAFDQIGMGIIGETVLNHRVYRGNLVLRHGHCHAVYPDNASDTSRFQYGDFLLQRKTAKQISAKQGDLNIPDAILPETALTP
jgi:hypothetical protein